MKRILAILMLAISARAADIVLYSTAQGTGTTTNIVSGAVTNGSLVDANGYCRPSDWLPLPELTNGEQKVVFLYAIFPPATGFDNYGGNYMGLRCQVSSGNYIVDWGNGTVTTNASNTTASNGWDYNAMSTNTLCSRGYKQVIVTITPQTAGANFGGTFDTKSYRDNRYALASSGILDINIEGGFTVFTIFGAVSATASPASYCERVKSVSCVWSSGASMFLNAYSLQSVDINTRSMNRGDAMFQGCSSLQNITFNSTTNMTVTTANMFNACYSLKRISGLDVSKSATLNQFCYQCYSLTSCSGVPSSASAASYASAFQFNYNLSDLGTIDLSACTAIMASTFGAMYSLQNVRLSNMRTNILAISFASSGLSREALTNLFNDLPDRSGTGLSQTITITGARGAADLTAADKAIATNKQWTVTN